MFSTLEHLFPIFQLSVFIIEGVILKGCGIRKLTCFFQNSNSFKREKVLKTHLNYFKMFCSFLVLERKIY